jgi:hypothetical protein
MSVSADGVLHTHEQFEFVANAAIDIAWPLFGAHKERVWAPGWDPQFLWPAIANDRLGMVFKIVCADNSAVWVNTRLDGGEHRAQYVYVIPEVVVTLINLKLSPNGRATRIEVSYERTALTAPANATVKHMAAEDRNAAAEWSEQINSYLKSCRPLLPE